MSVQQTQWQLVNDLLRQGRDELGPATASDTTAAEEPASQFEMFLENNELGLAWDALSAIADEVAAPRSVWEKLLLAAGLMSLAEQAHLAATRLCSPGLTERAS